MPNTEVKKTLLIAVVFCVASLLPPIAKAQAATSRGVPQDHGSVEREHALHIADFILSLQNAGGAVPDEKDSLQVNEDSNMEYALIALGAAYAATKDARYLNGLERGIRWLAAREEMDDTRWKGSWRYVYSAIPPYLPVPTSPGPGITDARGVDATSTLFVYLLYLDQKLAGNNTLVRTYAANAQAALDFVVHHNLDEDGFSWSSWQQHASDGQWYLYAMKYSADQGDVYLGMQAGALLYKVKKYEQVASLLKEQTPLHFFSKRDRRYGLGIDESGSLDTTAYVFAQGYLPWMWGDTPQNRDALVWLRSKVQKDGSLVEESSTPASSLNVAMLGMADAALRQPAPLESFLWLLQVPYDSHTGGIRDTSDRASREFNNVAGFCVISILGFVPFD